MRAGLATVLASVFVLGAFASFADAMPASGAAGSGIRVAVMPFGGTMQTRTGRAISEILSERLAARPLERVVGPDRYEGLPEGNPAPSAVRTYAEQLEVETVVTGQLSAGGGPGDDGVLRIEVRSGHSGAPTVEHRLVFADPAAVEGQLDDLALLILDGLGYQPPSAQSAAQSAATGPEEADEEAFTISGFKNDQPIAINSDELEVVEKGEDRQLVFRRNVKVVQGDITLRANELEAFYEKGDSRPEKLVATGAVRVVQGMRNARCDLAIYLRDDQVLRCTGKAELRDGCDRVRGQEIRFDLATERVKVLGAASVLIQAEGAGGECVEEAG